MEDGETPTKRTQTASPGRPNTDRPRIQIGGEMKTTTMILLIASLLAISNTSVVEAGNSQRSKRKERTVEAAYVSPAPAVALMGEFSGACAHGEGIGCARFETRASERFAQVKIEDALGLPVHGFITTADGQTILADFCGQTAKTVLLTDISFQVWVVEGPCSDATPAIASRGTVIVTLSNLP